MWIGVGTMASVVILVASFIYKEYADWCKRKAMCKLHLSLLKKYVEEDIGSCEDLLKKIKPGTGTSVSHSAFKSGEIINQILRRARYIDNDLEKKLIEVQNRGSASRQSINFIKNKIELVFKQHKLSEILHESLKETITNFRKVLIELYEYLS